jgi:hypothetical protein
MLTMHERTLAEATSSGKTSSFASHPFFRPQPAMQAAAGALSGMVNSDLLLRLLCP